MKIGDSSVEKAVDIVSAVIEKIRAYNYFGKCLADRLSDTECLVVFILGEDWCDPQGNADMTEFRGYANKDEIVMFFTRYETVESMEWLLLHEIGHWILKQNPDSNAFTYIVRQQHYKSVGIYKGTSKVFFNEDHFYAEYRKDDVYDADPEEHYADLFADAIMGKNLGRPWWRKQIELVKREAE